MQIDHCYFLSPLFSAPLLYRSAIFSTKNHVKGSFVSGCYGDLIRAPLTDSVRKPGPDLLCAQK